MTTNQVLAPVQLFAGNQQEEVTLAPVDANGKAQKLYSTPAWTVVPSDSTSPAFDGAIVYKDSTQTYAKIQASGAAIGTYNLTISAEADATPGVNTLTTTQVITIVADEDNTLGATSTGAEPIA